MMELPQPNLGQPPLLFFFSMPLPSPRLDEIWWKKQAQGIAPVKTRSSAQTLLQSSNATGRCSRVRESSTAAPQPPLIRNLVGNLSLHGTACILMGMILLLLGLK